MSDPIGHECGLAFVRLKKPLAWYAQEKRDPAWGLRRLHLLMQKQRNRGQDGAGLAVVKFDMPPGATFLRRLRSHRDNAIERVFSAAAADLSTLPTTPMDDAGLRRHADFIGDAYIGHLRYGTHSGRGISHCHPLLRKDNTLSKNLAIAGNFNMTNSQQLFQRLVEYGLSPVGDSDTQVVLERVGYCLDLEHRHLRSSMGPDSFLGLEGRELAEAISRELDIGRVLRRAAEDWDGGWLFAGLLGNGDAFIFRDPSGIRPGFWYEDDEVVAAASERAPLATIFDVPPDAVPPIEPGHALIVRRDGSASTERCAEERPVRQCTFERIYFSRGNDPDIYEERKELGRRLARPLLDLVDWNVHQTVYSFIPNTAETAYYGLVQETQRLVRGRQVEDVWSKVQSGSLTREQLESLSTPQVRSEKVAHKDQRLRTFITHGNARRDLVAHVYDITHHIVSPDDTLVVLDDSIVRGTTLRESIVTILSRLNPKRIVIASSAPPIMYPDCYGIDMSQLQGFIAFQAAVSLLEAHGEESLLEDIEADCLAQADLPPDQMQNHVGRIYERFGLEQIQDQIALLVRPDDLPWQGELRVVYQSVEDLRASMPEFTGDWYFTGEYPTPGGLRVLNRAFLNWREGSDARAY
jgi:amidophosphoribosyltransferase